MTLLLSIPASPIYAAAVLPTARALNKAGYRVCVKTGSAWCDSMFGLVNYASAEIPKEDHSVIDLVKNFYNIEYYLTQFKGNLIEALRSALPDILKTEIAEKWDPTIVLTEELPEVELPEKFSLVQLQDSIGKVTIPCRRFHEWHTNFKKDTKALYLPIILGERWLGMDNLELNWPQLVYAITKAKQVFACPSATAYLATAKLERGDRLVPVRSTYTRLLSPYYSLQDAAPETPYTLRWDAANMKVSSKN